MVNRRFGILAVVTGLVVGIACPAQPVLADSIDDMISAVSMPTVNEDPRVTTEVRPIYLHHQLANSFVTRGGSLDLVAVQARVAITDRIGFIATKDGYAWLNPDELIPEDEGFVNIGFGLKGVLYENPESASILSLGLRYETPWGNRDVFQGRGDGVLNPFLTGAQGFGDFHVQAYSGPRLAIDGADSSFWDTALHVDYRLGNFYPLGELNWVHVLDGGRRLPINDEGFDLVNFGSSDAGGNSIVTLAFGGRYRIVDWCDVGATGEFPITGTRDVWDWRVTADVIIRPFGWKSLI